MSKSTSSALAEVVDGLAELITFLLFWPLSVWLAMVFVGAAHSTDRSPSPCVRMRNGGLPRCRANSGVSSRQDREVMTASSAPAAVAAMERVTCQGCKRVGEFHRTAQDGSAFTETARVAGWRIWDGETVTGAPASVRLCPICAGTATPGQEVTLLGYTAGCRTCDADMAEESDEPSDYVFTEADAKEWARDHRCEKDTYITKPAGVS